MQKQVLIIGGGLAGSFMALESALRGHRVSMVDLPDPKAASRVAAGLYNIFTGREAKKTWMADEMLARLKAVLELPGFEGLQRHVHPMEIYRPYPSGQVYNDWMVRLQSPEYAAVARHEPVEQHPEVIHNPLGGLRILPCGWADAAGMCREIKTILQCDHGMIWVEGAFDYGSLDPATGTCTQAGVEGSYDEVIFAEGVGLKANPWFPFVEIRPLKGQVLEATCSPGLPQDQILIVKSFIIPKGKDFYTIGSTYEPRFEHVEPTPEGIENILHYVKQGNGLSVEVVEARASLRPTTASRRPVMGRHPQHSRLVVLNGLGTKGVLQAPWCAERLRAWLDGALDRLPAETDIARFLKNFG